MARIDFRAGAFFMPKILLEIQSRGWSIWNSFEKEFKERGLARFALPVLELALDDAITITRRVEHGIVNQHLDAVKTEGSHKTMTLDAQLLQVLAAWRKVTQFREAGDWLFPSPVKLGRLPYSYTGYWRALQTATGRAGLGKMGTHTFRHSYRSWLDSVGTAITVQQKLMRHSDIKTTLNVYGDVVTDEMERAGAKVASLALNPDSRVIPTATSH